VIACAAGQTQDSCVSGGPLSAQDASCDGIDDDCDGNTDEDFNGACGENGADLCVNGQVVHASNCNDGIVCNGPESCVAGFCVHNTPNLDDGNPCTVDACAESTGITHVDRALGTSCSDGDDCNGRELCVACRESENLIVNSSFERVWENGYRFEGAMPTDFWGISGTPDTYSFDNSWGLNRTDYSHFSGMTSVPDGVRWVVGSSGTPERIAQELREPLVSGQRYRISAKLFRAATHPAPGGYDVHLAYEYRTGNPRNNDLLLGYLGATTQTGWIDVSFEFTAPVNIAAHRLLVLTPRPQTAGSPSHTGLDVLKLVRSCAASGGLSCQRQDAPLVDDGEVCTADMCSNAGGVVHVPLSAGSACNGSGTCTAAGQCTNRAPAFTNVPKAYHVRTTGYTHQLQASDPDGDGLSFSRASNATCAWNITPAGLITGGVLASAGAMCIMAVNVTDSRGAVTTQTRLVQVVSIENSVPMVSSQPLQHALQVGELFSYRPKVWTRDPSAAISVAVSSGPSGLSVDASGLVTWIPSAAQLGAHEVNLLVTTPFGNVPHSFVISVLAPGG
jgi:hypothetical protein